MISTVSTALDFVAALLGWAGLVFVFTYAVSESTFLAWLRLSTAKLPFILGQCLSLLVYCPTCTAFWFGLGFAHVLPLESTYYGYVELASAGLAALGASTLRYFNILGKSFLAEGPLFPDRFAIKQAALGALRERFGAEADVVETTIKRRVRDMLTADDHDPAAFAAHENLDLSPSTVEPLEPLEPLEPPVDWDEPAPTTPPSDPSEKP
jgi:hypothetical protein